MIAPQFEDHSDRFVLCMVRAKSEKSRNSAISCTLAKTGSAEIVKHPDTPSSIRQGCALALGKCLPRGHPLPL